MQSNVRTNQDDHQLGQDSDMLWGNRIYFSSQSLLLQVIKDLTEHSISLAQSHLYFLTNFFSRYSKGQIGMLVYFVTSFNLFALTAVES